MGDVTRSGPAFTTGDGILREQSSAIVEPRRVASGADKARGRFRPCRLPTCDPSRMRKYAGVVRLRPPPRAFVKDVDPCFFVFIKH